MEFLKEFLGEELFAQVSKKLEGNDKVKLANLATGNYVDKGKFDSAHEKAATLEKNNSTLKEELENLKKSAGSNEELTKQITDLQTKYETDTKALNDKLAKQSFNYALSDELKASKAKNQKAVKALLDFDSIIHKDGKFVGLDEQLKTIKESDAYLFEGDPVPSGTGVPGYVPPQPTGGGDGWNFDFTAVRENKSK